MSEQDTKTEDKTPEPSEEDALVEALTEDETQDETLEDDDDAEEIEVGPQRFKLKKSDPAAKAIKEAWDGMQRAHTERSEKLSGQAKEFENREKEIAERVKIVQSFPREIAKVTQLQEQLDAYEKVDWAALRMKGEMIQLDNGKEISLADYHYGQYQNAKMQLDTAARDLKGKIDAEQAKRDGALAQQKQAFHQEMAAKIKDWSPSKDRELREYAVKNGAPKEVVDSIYQPALMVIAHKAMTLDKAMEKAQAAKAKAKQDREPPLEPPKGLKTGNGTTKRTLENARTAEEYQKIRVKQLAESRAGRIGIFKQH